MTQTLVYVSCAQSREIDVFSLAGERGEVSLRQRVATAGAPGPLRVCPRRRVLYAGTRADDALAFSWRLIVRTKLTTSPICAASRMPSRPKAGIRLVRVAL